MTAFLHIVGVFIVGLAIGLFVSKFAKQEGFEDYDNNCGNCSKPSPCGCPKPYPAKCKQPDMNKYVLKKSFKTVPIDNIK